MQRFPTLPPMRASLGLALLAAFAPAARAQTFFGLTGGDPQRPERSHRVQLVKLALRYPPQLLGAHPSCRFGAAPVEDILRPLIIEGPGGDLPAAVG
jgi:hypothetical protein